MYIILALYMYVHINIQVVITYVSYLCHQLLLLRKEGRAAVVIQRVWRAQRRFLQSEVMTKKQQKAIIVIQVHVLLGYHT